MSTFSPPICLNCIHLQGHNSEGERVCKAFPEGIPDKIYFEAGDHTKAWPGDHDIRFEPKPSE